MEKGADSKRCLGLAFCVLDRQTDRTRGLYTDGRNPNETVGLTLNPTSLVFGYWLGLLTARANNF